jgi:two-component system, NarL family, response regulator YdfI
VRVPIEFELIPVVHGLAKMPRLTPTEKKVLDCVLEGMVNKEVAVKMGTGERTAKFHVSSLFNKFGVKSRFELIQMLGTRSKDGEK